MHTLLSKASEATPLLSKLVAEHVAPWFTKHVRHSLASHLGHTTRKRKADSIERR